MARNPYLVQGMLVRFNYTKPGEQPVQREGFVNEVATTDKVLNIQDKDNLPVPFKSFRWAQITDLAVL
jgi:hypothetical protein